MPSVAPNVTGTPISALRLLAPTLILSEFVRKLAVSALVPPAFTDVGFAVRLSFSHGLKSAAFTPATRSHGAALGPALQPHQLFSIDTTPLAEPLYNPLPEAAVLPTMRLKLAVSVGALPWVALSLK